MSENNNGKDKINGYYYNGKVVIGSNVILAIIGTLLVGYATWLTGSVTSNQSRINQVERDLAVIQTSIQRIEDMLKEIKDEDRHLKQTVLSIINKQNNGIKDATVGIGDTINK